MKRLLALLLIATLLLPAASAVYYADSIQALGYNATLTGTFIGGTSTNNYLSTTSTGSGATNIYIGNERILTDTDTLSSAGGWTDDGSTVRLTTSGDDVGIGTSSPNTKLDVDGNITISGTHNNRNNAFVWTNTNGNEGIRAKIATVSEGAYGDKGIAFYTGDANDYSTADVTTERVRIDKDGNLGIGTNNPASPLHLNTSGPDTLYLERDSTNVWEFRVTHGGLGIDSNALIIKPEKDTGTSSDFAIKTSGTADSGTPDFIVEASGEVGIGTTSPGAALDVAGEARAQTFRDRDDTSYYVDPASSTAANLGGDADLNFNTLRNTVAGTRNNPANPLIMDYAHNFLWWANNRFDTTINDATGVTSLNNIYDPGDSYVRLDMSSTADPLIITAENFSLTTSSASTLRAFFQWHGNAGYDNLTFEVRNSSGGWNALDNYQGTSGELIVTQTTGNAGMSSYPWTGLRLILEGKTSSSGSDYIEVLGFGSGKVGPAWSGAYLTRKRVSYAPDGMLDRLNLNDNKIINLKDPDNAQDAATKNYVDTQTSNNPDGSGAANHVAYWTDSDTISHDNNQLYWDANANELGIGTASPGAKLEIQYSDATAYSETTFPSTTGLRIDQSGHGDDSEASIVFASENAAGSIGNAVISAVAKSGGSSADLSFRTRNSGTLVEGIRIDQTGNVGIGVEQPGELLELRKDLACGSDTEFARLKFSDAGQGAIIGINRTGCDAGADLTFQTQDQSSNTILERMRIDEDGQVGIGTDSPGGKLHVNEASGNANIIAEAEDWATMQIKSDSNGENLADPTLRFYTGGTERGRIGIDESDADKFMIGPDSLGNDAWLTINQNGNIGIGETNPTERLHVVGSGDVIPMRIETTGGTGGKPGIELEDPTAADYGARIYFDDTSSTLRLTTLSNSVEQKSIVIKRDNGNVGIGHNNPQEQLHVNGSTRILGGAGTDTSLVVGAQGASNEAIVAKFVTADDALELYGWGETEGSGLNIGTDGDVGVGTTDPQANFASGTTTTKLAINAGTSSGYTETAHFAAGTDADDTGAIVRIGQVSNDRGLFIKAGRGTSDQAKAIFGLRNSGATDQNVMTLEQGGDVGIGTSSPTERFVVKDAGDGWTSSHFAIEDDSSTNQWGMIIGTGDTLYTGYNEATKFEFQTDGDFRTVGDVQVDGNDLTFNAGPTLTGTDTRTATLTGTHSGDMALHIDAPTNAILRFQEGGTSKWGFLSSYPAAGELTLHNYDTGENVITVENTTEVGIGTADPEDRLHVSDTGTADIATIERTDGNMVLNLRAPSTSNTNLYFQEGTTNEAGIRWDGTNDRMEIKTNNLGTNAMTILDGGDVGMGTDNPDVPLEIQGGSGISDLTQGRGALQIGDYASTHLAIDTNEIQVSNNGAASGLYLQANGGNVGVGTNNPVGLLTIGDGTNTHFYSNGQLKIKGSGSPSGDLDVAGSLVVKTDGDVGIGTNNPATKLHVNGPAGSDSPTILFDGGGSPEALFQTGSGKYNWRVAVQEDVDQGFEIASGTNDSNAANDAGTDWNERFVIKGDSGNIGIGTNNPGDKLEVNGNINLPSNNQYVRWQDGQNYIGTSTAGWNFRIANTGNDGDTLRFLGDSGVEVGTMSNSGDLQLDGDITVSGGDISDGSTNRVSFSSGNVVVTVG